MDFKGYGGGPLPPKIGNQLASAGVRINPIYGATEFGSPSHLVPAKGSDYMDWEYLRFFEHTNVRWVPLDENNDMFELQLLVCLVIGYFSRPRELMLLHRHVKHIAPLSVIYLTLMAMRRPMSSSPIRPKKDYGKCGFCKASFISLVLTFVKYWSLGRCNHPLFGREDCPWTHGGNHYEQPSVSISQPEDFSLTETFV